VSGEGRNTASARKMIPDEGYLFNGGASFHQARI
jgi:hypothetical protein